jgi:thiol-disulfide isomerase/thioredoxin
MQRFMSKAFLLLVIYFMMSKINAQKLTSLEHFAIGQAVPNVVLKNVQDYSSSNFSLRQLTGKWLILDFWHQYCTSCISSMSHLNELNKAYANKVQFLLVGYTGSFNGIHPSSQGRVQKLYEAVKKRKKLDLPIAFDSVLWDKYNLQVAPYLVIVNPNGIIKAITSEVTAANIEDLIAGKSPDFRKVSEVDSSGKMEAPSYNENIPFLTNASLANGGRDTAFLYRSLLAPWNRNMGFRFTRMNRPRLPKSVEFFGINVASMYMLAYVGDKDWWYQDSLYGQFWRIPLLETSDTTIFKKDFESGKNYFCYSLTVPANKATVTGFMGVMQRDLQNYFGFEVAVEKKLMPCWKLIVTSQSKKDALQTKGAEIPLRINPGMGLKGTIEMPVLMRLIFSSGGDLTMNQVFINETGITGKININLEAFMSDFEDLRRGLLKNGLKLQRSEKEMKVVVLKGKSHYVN